MERVLGPGTLVILLIGLLFVAGGFATFVAGHVEGLLLVFVGVAMSWAGWVGSQAKGLSSLIAAALNTLDVSVTLASWNYEINPLVLAAGPTLFITAKMLCSLAIVLFAIVSPKTKTASTCLVFISSSNCSNICNQHGPRFTASYMLCFSRSG